MSTQAGLLCLDKALHMADRCRGTSVPVISGPWAEGVRLSSWAHLLSFLYLTSACSL